MRRETCAFNSVIKPINPAEDGEPACPECRASGSLSGSFMIIDRITRFSAGVADRRAFTLNDALQAFTQVNYSSLQGKAVFDF